MYISLPLLTTHHHHNHPQVTLYPKFVGVTNNRSCALPCRKTSAFITVAAFLLGALCSGLAGYVGMWVSVRANVRVSSAARRSAREALQVFFIGHVYSCSIGNARPRFDEFASLFCRLLFGLVDFLLWWLSEWLSLVLPFFMPPSMFGWE